MTEEEFLASYSLEKYDRPAVTTDVVVLNRRRDGLFVLLIKRGGHPFRGAWALPGGFLNRGESVEECALRELAEETSLKLTELRALPVRSEPGRDPRGWIISNPFLAVVGDENQNAAQAGDDAADARWFRISCEQNRLTLRSGDLEITANLRVTERFGLPQIEILPDETPGERLAFDHAKILWYVVGF